MRSRGALLVALCICLVGSSLHGSLASAQTLPVPPPETPERLVQIWNANLHQLREPAWRGFVERLSTNQFQPDVITVQDLSRCDGNGDGQGDVFQIRDQLDQLMGSHWNFVHSAPSGSCGSRNAIFWNTNRFFVSISPITWDPAGCAAISDIAVAVVLGDRKNSSGIGRSVTVASVHFDPLLGTSCLSSAMHEAHNKVSSMYSFSDLTIIAGDFNQSPDLDSPAALANGLEADPECWYRRFSAPHLNTTTLTQTACGTAQSDRYYDAVWMYPGSGGGTNPAATSFCQQFTYATTLSFGNPDAEDVENSCTDENLDGNPDKKRIDQIWLRWGANTGSSTAPLSNMSQYVQYASADLGIRLNSSLYRYSDHRAVQALVEYPAVGLPQ